MSTFFEQLLPNAEEEFTPLEKLERDNKILMKALNCACEEIFDKMTCSKCQYKEIFLKQKGFKECNICNTNKFIVIETIKQNLLKGVCE